MRCSISRTPHFLLLFFNKVSGEQVVVLTHSYKRLYKNNETTLVIRRYSLLGDMTKMCYVTVRQMCAQSVVPFRPPKVVAICH